MSKPGFRGRCMFCNEPIPVSDPLEHILPKWLRNFRPKGMLLVHEPGVEVQGDCIKRFGSHTFRAKGPEITTNKVCKECNQGWMSDLEAQASPLLTPLIKGETANLIVDDQTFISKWATKTMLMCQLPNPNDQIIPISDYHDFFYDKAASKFSELFLACYRGSKLEFIRCTQMHLDKPDTPPGIIPDGYRFVLIIGCFVLEVAGSCNEELLGPTFPGMLGDALVEIWPATVDRSWPPRIVLDDVSILLFLGMPPGVEIP